MPRGVNPGYKTKKKTGSMVLISLLVTFTLITGLPKAFSPPKLLSVQ